MKAYAFLFLGLAALLSGCNEKEEDSDPIDRMVRIEEEDQEEWSVPQDKQLAGETNPSIQERVFRENGQLDLDDDALR